MRLSSITQGFDGLFVFNFKAYGNNGLQVVMLGIVVFSIAGSY